MRSFVPKYELRVPRTLDEALQLLSSAPGAWRPFAGGTDLMVLLEAGKLEGTRFVSLWGSPELRFITVDDREVAIGALATYSDIRRHPVVQQEFPMLCAAAAETGGVANQNRGTLGGNIANASPAADSPPALLAYGAFLELVSSRGVRRVPYELFHTGYKQMDLASDELIKSIHLLRRAGGRRHFYRKVGPRRAQAISKVCVAGVLEIQKDGINDVRLAFGSVGPTVIRATHVESAVRGKTLDERTIAAAREAVEKDIAPIDDIRSTAHYRLTVSRNLVEQLLADAFAARST